MASVRPFSLCNCSVEIVLEDIVSFSLIDVFFVDIIFFKFGVEGQLMILYAFLLSKKNYYWLVHPDCMVRCHIFLYIRLYLSCSSPRAAKCLCQTRWLEEVSHPRSHQGFH